MTPQKMPQETRSMGKPPGWDDKIHGPCGALSIIDLQTPAGNKMVSAWRPSKEELSALADGGLVYLSIMGAEHPVVSIHASMV